MEGFCENNCGRHIAYFVNGKCVCQECLKKEWIAAEMLIAMVQKLLGKIPTLAN